MRKRKSNRPRPPEFKIGIVRRYAVHIPKKDLLKWEQKGFVNSGGRPAIVPIPPDKVWVWGIPQTLADTGIERLIGRKVDGFSSGLGTYGMGGHGFWGVCLYPFEDAKFGEYLVLPISHGSRFVRINGFRLSLETKVPLIGSVIDEISLAERRCDLKLWQKSESNILTLYLDSPSAEDLHIHPIDYEKGQIADYLIFQDRRGILSS